MSFAQELGFGWWCPSQAWSPCADWASLRRIAAWSRLPAGRKCPGLELADSSSCDLQKNSRYYVLRRLRLQQQDGKTRRKRRAQTGWRGRSCGRTMAGRCSLEDRPRTGYEWSLAPSLVKLQQVKHRIHLNNRSEQWLVIVATSYTTLTKQWRGEEEGNEVFPERIPNFEQNMAVLIYEWRSCYKYHSVWDCCRNSCKKQVNCVYVFTTD